MLDEQTAKNYYDELVDILERQKLDWVVEQVSTEVRFGKVESKEFLVVKETRREKLGQFLMIEQQPEYKARRKEKFNVIVPYSEQEKLELIIKAISRLIVETTDIEEHVLDFVKYAGGETVLSNIIFYTEGHETGLEISQRDLGAKKIHVNNLHNLLDELSNEGHNAN